MPSMSLQTRETLINSAKKVYHAYAALAFYNQPLAQSQLSLADLCQTMIDSGQRTKKIKVAGHNFEISCSPELNSNEYSLKIVELNTTQKAFKFKSLDDYSSCEKLQSIACLPLLKLQRNKRGEFALATSIKENEILGGSEKLDLYNSHLLTLSNIIRKIESEQDLSSLLVALATGSGKTFVQAVWLYVLYISQVNAIFAMPDKLVSQFKDDLKQLLPDSMVNQILELRKNATDDRASETIKSLSRHSKKILIASDETLLDHHFADLQKLNTDDLLLSFDEQHLIINRESRNVKLFALSDKFVSLYLTATPSFDTYQKTGQRPVAIMSSGQKEKAGQGKFPQCFIVEAKSVSDKFKLSSYNLFSKKFWRELGTKLTLIMASNVEKEPASAAISTLEELPFIYIENHQEPSQRWGLEMPMARKMLVITSENEDVINIFNSIKLSEQAQKPPYQAGNLVDRKNVFNFFLVENQDTKVCQSYKDSIAQEFKLNLQRLAKKSQYPIEQINTDLRTQLKHNIFHNIVEIFIQDLSKQKTISLNKKRKANLEDLVEQMIKNYQLKSKEYYYNLLVFDAEKNTKGIDEHGAKALAEILEELSFRFANKMQQKDFDWLINFIDNWSLNKELANQELQANHLLDSFAESHLMMGVMANMQASEMPIQDSTPFFSLSEDRYLFHEETQKAKVRPRSAVETLYNMSEESRFTPVYFNTSEQIADNYFRLGLVGLYVSNKKTEGFSDPNLHTVINLSNHCYSDTNNPQTLIQGIGRNRGLDQTITPCYIHGLGKNAYSPFNLSHLNKDDYYPDLFTAQDEYNHLFLENLSNKVCDEVIYWLNKNTKDNGEVDESELKRQVLGSICKALRQLNQANGYKLKLSREKLGMILSKTMLKLDKEIEQLKTPYKLSFFVRLVGNILNFGFECYYSLRRIKPYLSLKIQSWKNDRAEQPFLSNEDKAYIKIIENTSFKEIIAQGAFLNELANIIQKKQKGFIHSVKTRPEVFLKRKTYHKINKNCHDAVVPALLALVKKEHQNKINLMLKQIHNFPKLLISLEAEFNHISNTDSLSEELICQIFNKMFPTLNSTASWFLSPTAIKQDMLTHFQSLGFIQSNPSYQKQLSQRVGDYLAKDFLSHTKAFLSSSAHKVLTKRLSNKQLSASFIQYLISNLDKLKQAEDRQSIILKMARTFFNIEGLKTLQDNQRACIELSQKLKSLQEEPSIDYLNEETTSLLLNIVEQDLLQILINYYPHNSRKHILSSVNSAGLKNFISTHSNLFFKNLEKNPQAAAELLFSFFIDEQDLPPTLDQELEKVRAKKILSRFKSKLEKMSYTSLALKNVTSLNLFNPISQPQYALVPSVIDFLESEEFDYLSGLIMPYEDWCYLKRLLSSDTYTSALAHALIDKMAKSNNSELTAEDVIAIINEALELKDDNIITSNEHRAAKAKSSLKAIIADCQQQPEKHLAPIVTQEINDIVIENLLPLIASFIKNDDLQLKFLEQSSKQDLLAILNHQQDKLEIVQSEASLEEKATALSQLCATLAPTLTFNESDFRDPEVHAKQQAELIQKKLKAISLGQYFLNTEFYQHLSLFYNQDDIAIIQKALLTINANDQTNAELIANELIDADDSIETSNINNLLDAVLQKLNLYYPSGRLQRVVRLEERLKNAKALFEDVANISDGKSQYLNVTEINHLLRTEIIPLLAHPQFKEFISNTIGYLSQQEIEVILCAQKHIDYQPNKELKNKHQRQINAHANDLFLFIQQIKNSNIHSLFKLLCLSENQQGELDLKNTRIANITSSLSQVLLEVKNIHCYYNQHNEKGMMFEEPFDTAFIQRLSQQIKSSRVSLDPDSFMSVMSRRLFFVQGIRNGLPKACAISHENAKPKIQRLQNIRNHILQPLWWGSKLSNLGSNLLQLTYDVYSRFIRTSILRIFYSTPKDNHQLKKVPKSHQSYMDTSLSYARALNSLDPLSAMSLLDNPVQHDVIENLEQQINDEPQVTTLDFGDGQEPYHVTHVL